MLQFLPTGLLMILCWILNNLERNISAICFHSYKLNMYRMCMSRVDIVHSTHSSHLFTLTSSDRLPSLDNKHKFSCIIYKYLCSKHLFQPNLEIFLKYHFQFWIINFPEIIFEICITISMSFTLLWPCMNFR